MEHRRNSKQAEALRQQVLADLQGSAGPKAGASSGMAQLGQVIGNKIRTAYGDRTVEQGVDRQMLSSPETALPEAAMGESPTLFGGEGTSELMKFSMGGSKTFTHRELKKGFRRL